jgi:Flp pilus assembly CpaF family ATPase
MFLIINNQDIHRAEGPRINIGLAPGQRLAVNGDSIPNPLCTLNRDAAGSWHLTRYCRETVTVNGLPLAAQQPQRLNLSDEIRLGSATIRLRVADAKGTLARTLSEKRYELQAELHNAVLDRLRITTMQQPDETYRQQIELELDRQLAALELGPEMEEFLSTQALCEMMVDRTRGYGRASRKASREAGLRRFSALIARLEKTIQLEADARPEQQAERIETLVPWVIRARRDQISAEDKRALATGLLREQLIDCMFGLGPLEDLLVAPDISEIMVLPSGAIFIERDGRLENSGRRMPSVEIARRVIERIVTREGRRIDQSSPMVDARLSDGSRGNFIIEPVSLRGPVLTIRRFAAKRLTMDELIANGTLSLPAAAFLRACIRARKNLIVSGGTGSGKTTLLNALAAYVSDGERIVTVEDTAEINLGQEHVVTLQAKNANLEGKGAITIRQLVRNALRQRPDRIIVGECRGGEALDMLQAMNTGHDGSLTTAHANTPQGALRRLETLALEAEGIDLPSRAIREQSAAALDVIVQIARFQDGRRRITSICEVVEFDEADGTIIVEEIYQLRHNRKKIRFAPQELAFTGCLPTFIGDLIESGGATLEELF